LGQFKTITLVISGSQAKGNGCPSKLVHTIPAASWQKNACPLENSGFTQSSVPPLSTQRVVMSPTGVRGANFWYARLAEDAEMSTPSFDSRPEGERTSKVLPAAALQLDWTGSWRLALSFGVGMGWDIPGAVGA
jgi:hypothetical protein